MNENVCEVSGSRPAHQFVIISGSAQKPNQLGAVKPESESVRDRSRGATHCRFEDAEQFHPTEAVWLT